MKFDIRELAAERRILCAHRGIWGGNIPCNNIIAYDFAIREGADMVEIDVTKSADGELFIFHDETADRFLGIWGSGGAGSGTDEEKSHPLR